jgi:GntR family transcriptional regulator, transcriptional repressor for pyruvate dehydrogenase complex
MTKLKLGPIKKERLHEAISDRLEQMILDGVLAPGAVLPSEIEMTSDLGVSRTVVRDAMRVLAAKGLVEVRHGVGTTVTFSSRARLAEAISVSLRRHDYTPWEVFIMRRGLEMVVVEEAVAHATAEQIAEMRAILDNCRRLGRDPQAVLEHIRFHQFMVAVADNRVLADLLEPITVFVVPEDFSDPETAAAARAADNAAYWTEHDRIVDAIERRDLPAARVAMLEHLAVLEHRAHRTTERAARAATLQGELAAGQALDSAVASQPRAVT